MASDLKPCGGCGATSEQERCIGCLHDFGTPESAWVATHPVPIDLKARDREHYKLIRKSLQNKGLLPATTDTGLGKPVRSFEDTFSAEEVVIDKFFKTSATDTVSKDGTDGLVTVGNITEECLLELKQMLCGEIHPCNDIGDVTDADIELVTRSQAESEIRKVRQDADELLAAERAESDRLRKLFKTRSSVHSKHVKELITQHEREREIYGQAAQDFRERAEKAEAKLAAAEKVREAAIELDEAISDDFNIFGAQQKLRAALGGKS